MTSRKGLTEEEFLRQMRRDAVEDYKSSLVNELEDQIEELNDLSLNKRSERKTGIQRGLRNAKTLIQSNKIPVE